MKYKTRQRQELLAFLRDHRSQQLSVCAIAEGLKSKNVSQSSVYRNRQNWKRAVLFGAVFPAAHRKLHFRKHRTENLVQ